MTPFILGALLAATLTLPAFARLIRQRDAAVRRGNLALAGWKSDTRMHAAREAQQQSTGRTPLWRESLS